MFDINIAKQVEKNAAFLAELFDSLSPPSKDLEILLNIIHAFDKYQIDLKYAATVLKYFYDNDLLREEFLLKWGSNQEGWATSNLATHFLYTEDKLNAFKDSCKAFLEWLKQEEVEEEEEEEEQKMQEQKQD